MADTTGVSPLRNAFSGLMHAPLRFPVPLACAAGWAGITIAREHGVADLAWSVVASWQVLFLGGLFLSLAATLFAEGRGWGRLATHIAALAAFGFAGVAVWLQAGPDGWEGPAFYLLVPGGILLMIVAPFLRRDADDRALWDFNLASWLSVLFGGIVAVGLGLGLTAILGGLETLFDLDIHSDFYEDAWIICMSLIWPWQTLAGIPGACDEASGKLPPRWTEYVASWLLIPLALVYLGLLYAFAAKSLITWDLPRGTIGWLVGGFAAFGLAVWSAAFPFRVSGNLLTRVYSRWFHLALVVPVILLAVGIGIRVAEYGVTEKRYALILLTLWLGGIALYGMLKHPPRLAAAPATFAVMLIAGTVGPWGAASVSIRSQLGQLQELLENAGIMADGTIRPDEGLADPAEVRRISGIVRYLARGGREDELRSWLEQAGAEPKGGEDNQALLALMGLDYVEEWQEEGYFSYSVGEPSTFEVEGFDIAHNIGFGEDETTEFGTDAGRYSVRVAKGKVAVAKVGRPDDSITFDLAALAEELRHLDLKYNDPDSTRAMTLEASRNGMHVRLYVQHMNGRRNGFGANEIDYGTALLLVGRTDY